MFVRRAATYALIVLAVSSSPAVGRAGLLVKPVLQNIRPSSVNIMFETSHSATATLRLSLGSDMTGAASFSISAGYIRKLLLMGLTESTRYYYQIISDGETSAVGTFLTSPADGSRLPFRFVAYGDTRLATWYEDIVSAYGDNDDHQAVVQSIATTAPNFLVHLGDYAQNGNDLSAVRNFFSVEKDFLVRYPMLATYGNHEFQGMSGSTTADTYFDSYLTAAPNASDFAFYSYDYGNAHVLVINTGKYSDADEAYDLVLPGTPQYEFIESDLAAAAQNSRIDHIFVSLHVPLYSSANFGDNPTLIKTLEPLFITYGVKVVFMAHEHDYQRLTMNGITYVLTGGGGGPILDILNCNCDDGTAAHLVTYRGRLNYVVVNVNGGALSFEVRGVQGDGNSSSWVIETFDL